jgi:hypothetical protein
MVVAKLLMLKAGHGIRTRDFNLGKVSQSIEVIDNSFRNRVEFGPNGLGRCK